jgi:hypothetical protein
MQQPNLPPNIAAGFKNSIGPSVQNYPPLPQMQIPQVPQVPVPTQIVQTLAPDPMSIPMIAAPDAIVPVNLDVYSIFGYELQKKYLYIGFIIVLGIMAYFLWKWWVGPKKTKKGRVPQDVEEYTEEEEEGEEEEEEDEVYIPQYPPKTNDSKNSK